MNKLSTLTLFMLASLGMNTGCTQFPVCEPPPPQTPMEYACEPASLTATWPESVKRIQVDLAWSFYFAKSAFSYLPSDVQQRHQQAYQQVFDRVMQTDKIFVDVVNAAIAAGNSDWGTALADATTAVQEIIDFVHKLESDAHAKLWAGADDKKLEQTRKALATAQQRLDQVKPR